MVNFLIFIAKAIEKSIKGVIPALDTGIQPYFHFYAKSKIRDFLCSSTQIR
ncbi:hypothetical protein [Wolbachia endosymbiont of Ctenocephalides felis wCfeJ]|uniref:hypothetical protein n=1 Tax=Wolbachia endosymbiont of Ctenocephalides felis wCfeJ TaxID=2732594 RepID=UPI0014461B0A|nr:hypothetical protein [Wolbachia endosymbiont of Ctenocephalides felis wCfeJ]